MMPAAPLQAAAGAGEPDDDALAVRAAAGDEAAFARLYDRHVDAVYAQLTRLLGPTPDRDDVVQQVFLNLHDALGRFRGEAALATFLHRIAINAALDHLRRRVRQPSRPSSVDAAALDRLVADAPSPAVRLQRREELDLMFACLERLTPDKRVAFVLVAVEGLSLREAAALVGARPDTVKQRVLHARRELLALIARDERRAPRSLR